MTLIWGIVLGSLGLVHWGPVLGGGIDDCFDHLRRDAGSFLAGHVEQARERNGRNCRDAFRARDYGGRQSLHDAGLDLVRARGHRGDICRRIDCECDFGGRLEVGGG